MSIIQSLRVASLKNTREVKRGRAGGPKRPTWTAMTLFGISSVSRHFSYLISLTHRKEFGYNKLYSFVVAYMKLAPTQKSSNLGITTKFCCHPKSLAESLLGKLDRKLRYLQLMVQHKIISKRSSWKNKETFIDICQNCWESNSLSQPEKNTIYWLSQPFSYYYKYTTKVELCIVVVPFMLKFWKIKFETD